MRSRRAAAVLAWASLLAPAVCRAQAVSEPSGGVYQIVADSLDGSAGGCELAPAGSGCADGPCLAGAIGQVATSSSAAGSVSVGSGYFDFQYNYERLLLLLPGESLVPGSPTAKRGTPSSLLVGSPFNVTALGTDLAGDVASTASVSVRLSTSDFAPMTQTLVAGATTFNSAVFSAGGLAREILVQDQSGGLTAFSSAVDVFAPTASSPTVTLDIANASVQTTLSGAITGGASDASGVTQVRVAVQRKGVAPAPDVYFDWTANGFSAAMPTFATATLANPGATRTSWSLSFPDANLTSGASYYLVAQSSDASNNFGVVESTFFFNSTALSAGSSGDGEGSATVDFNHGGVGCQVMIASVAFTAGADGIQKGGMILLHIPDNWQAPTKEDTVNNPSPTPGEMAVTSTTTYSLTFNPKINSVSLGANWLEYAVTDSRGVTPGQTIDFIYTGFSGTGAAAVGPQTFTIKTAASSSGLAKSISVQPAADLVAGPPSAIAFEPAQPMALGPLQTAPTMQVLVYDQCGNSTNTATAVDVDLRAGQESAPDPGAAFYQEGGASLPSNRLVVPAGAGASPRFYYATSGGGLSFENLIATAAFSGETTGALRFVTLLSNALSLSGVSIDTGTREAGVLTATVTAGSFSGAFINFTLADPNASWDVIISTSNETFTPELVHRRGSGQPGRTLVWYGLRETSSPQTLVPPGGPYYVKIVAGNVVEDASLRVYMSSSAFVYGTVKSTGAFALVQAVGSGSSYLNQAQADDTGHFTIYGLKDGTRYNIIATTGAVIGGQAVQIQSSSFNVVATAAGTNVGEMPFPGLAQLRVSVRIPAAAPYEFWGGVSVQSSGGQQFYGTLHYPQSADKSDNGQTSFGSNASTWTVFGLSPGLYTVQVSLPQVGISSSLPNIPVSAASVTDLAIAPSRKANVYGYAIVPSTTQYGTWVSVQAMKSGQLQPSIFGGISLSGSQFGVMQTSGVYSLYGLDPGSWTITARASGFVSVSSPVYISSSADVGNPAAGGFDLTLSSGGALSGVLRITGDSSGLPKQNSSSSGLTAYVNAVNTQTGSSGFAQVVVSTDSALASSTFTITGLEDGSYYLSTFISGTQPVQLTTTVARGRGFTTLTTPVDNARAALTFQLQGPTAPAGYHDVSLFYAGSSVDGGAVQSQDVVPGSTIAYFASSATWLSPPLSGGDLAVAAYDRHTGAFQTASLSLSNGTTSYATLDLSALSNTVSGSVVLTSNVNFPATSTGGTAVSVSSAAGVLSNSSQVQYCLAGDPAPVALSAFHLELVPVPADNGPLAVLNASLLASSKFSGSCAGDLTNFSSGNGKPADPFLAYIGRINTDGSFTFSNVPAGTYVLRVPTDLDGNPATDEIPPVRQAVTVTTYSISGLNFSIGQGVSLSGRVLMPSGLTGSRIILLILNDASGNPVKTTFANFSGAASAAYRFDGIPNGTYALVTQDFSLPQSFGAKPIIVNVAGAAVTQDIQLVQTGIIKGKMAVQQTLAGSTTAQVTLVTDANETQLPQELQVYAQANPFFLGGQVNALTGGGASSTGTGGTSGSSSRPKLDSTGRFEIDGLLPGVYDVHFQAPNDSSDNSSLRLVSSMVPAVTVTGGQTTDIGTFNLTAADQIQGAVADAATKAPLANIPMLARPAATQSQDYDTIAAVTDVNGKYTLVGLDPAVKLYDIIANMAQQGGSQITPPYESQTALAVDVTSTAVVDFALKPARLSISGRIVGAPGGPPLRQPFSSSVEAPPLGAIVFVQKSGVPPRDNPLGDTQIATDVQGRFTIPSLTTGTYNLTMVALGHASVAQSISVSTGPIDIGTIQLKLGGTLSGALSKPDGSNPGASELSDVLAVTNDFSQVLAATLTYDPNTRTYTNYSISGFLPGSVYRVLLLGGTSSVPVSPPEVQHIVFSSAEQSMTQDIVMRPAPPFVLARARRAANGQFAVTFDLSQPLRQKTAADDDLAAVLSTYSAAGALSRIQLNAARFELSAVYTPAVGESSFTLLLSGHSNQTDPDSIDPVNPEFVYHSTFGFYTGLDGYYSNTISNTNGGTLLIDGDAGRVTIPGGAFQIETSSSIPVSLAVSREALSQAATSGLRGAAANLSALRFHGGAYPPGLLAAVAATPPQVNPLSGFYNILLPLGVRTALSKPVQMTVAYSTGTDPTKLNLYWYNAAANAYVLQQDVTGAAPVIDYANHTISVNVNHFSTFVLFNADVSVITGNAFSGEFAAYNFPNPFDLSVKTVSTIHGAGKQTVRGTMISVALPSDVSGDGSVRIYNVAGERVRTLDLGTLRAGQYVYQAWDGRNDSGRDVASGVYIAQVRVGNQSRFFKMALIK